MYTRAAELAPFGTDLQPVPTQPASTARDQMNVCVCVCVCVCVRVCMCVCVCVYVHTYVCACSAVNLQSTCTLCTVPLQTIGAFTYVHMYDIV